MAYYMNIFWKKLKKIDKDYNLAFVLQKNIYNIYRIMPKKSSATKKRRTCSNGKRRNRVTKRCRCRKVCK